METKTLEGEAMKFVLNGRTFDTATATRAAIARGISTPEENDDGREVRYEHTLYRTSKGAFFVHSHTTTKLGRGGKPVVSDCAEELTNLIQINGWILEFDPAIIDATGLDLPPEA